MGPCILTNFNFRVVQIASIVQRVVFRIVLTFFCDFYCPLYGCAVQTPVLLAFFCVIASSTASPALSPIGPVTPPQSAAAAVTLVSARLPAQVPPEVPKSPFLHPAYPTTSSPSPTPVTLSSAPSCTLLDCHLVNIKLLKIKLRTSLQVGIFLYICSRNMPSLL